MNNMYNFKKHRLLYLFINIKNISYIYFDTCNKIISTIFGYNLEIPYLFCLK